MDQREYSLDHNVRTARQRIDSYIAGLRNKSGDDAEFTEDAESAIELQRRLDASKLASLIAMHIATSGNVFEQTVIFQSARLCMQAADALAGHHVQLDVRKLEERYQVWMKFDALQREAYEYLEERESVDEFIADYRSFADPLNSYGRTTEIAFALVLKWLDEQIEIDYLEGEFGSTS